jgi:effector-binding domain-containing protein
LGKAEPNSRDKGWRGKAGRGDQLRRTGEPALDQENPMSFAVFRSGLMAAVLVLGVTAPTLGQTRGSTPSSQATSQAAPQNTPTPGGDAFGEDAALTAKTIVYVKGSGTWDKTFNIISGSFKKIKTYLDKEGIKPDGLPMTIFTATDDTGFEYQAAVPIAAAPKNPPHGDIAIGQSPEGKAIKFVHRGAYEDLDNMYEAITNYLDDRRLEARDLFIEEYETDPAVADAKTLVVNVYVLIKGGQSPG